MTEQQSFGQWLRQRRRELDLTQAELGRAVGCSQVTIRKIESDDLRPSRQLSELLVDKLGIPLHRREASIRFARGGVNSPPETARPTRNNLPHWLTSFIGREREVEEIQGLLHRSRLVTLIGAGGCGKTRLCVQTAARMEEHYPGGIWFVELASILDPQLIPQSVAMSFGLQRGVESSYEDVLVNFLRDQDLLLILDNCEHVLEACLQLLETLLRSCSKITILATSREKIGIAGERAYRVPSLIMFDPSKSIDVHTLEQSEAIRLFNERAVANLPDFTLNEKTLPYAARICFRLDGIPLAIELAAARMSHLRIEEIADRLEDRFRLLSCGIRTALPRQRTLRSSIDWSYGLLSEAERLLLQRLSIFSVSWNLPAAEAVCGWGALEPGEILELLASLVDKSLVGVDLSGNQARYRFLETVRQYALEKLKEGGGETALRDCHLDFFLDLAQKVGPCLKTERIVECLGQLNPELDNLRSALDWALDKNSPQAAQNALSILIGLDYFWAIRALYWETYPRILRALELLGGDNVETMELRARGLFTLAMLQTDFSTEVGTVAYLDRSVAIFRQVENQGGLALGLALRSYLIFRQHAFFPPDPRLSREQAERDQEESFKIAAALSQALSEDHQRIIAWVDCWNGAGEVFRPDFARARALGLKVQDTFRKLGDRIGEQYGLLVWLVASQELDDQEKLLPAIAYAMDLAKQINHKRYLSFFNDQRMTVYFALDRYEEVITCAREALNLAGQLGNTLEVLEGYQQMGIAYIYHQKYTQAQSYLQEGLHLATQRMKYADPYHLFELLVGAARLAAQMGKHTLAAKLVGFVEGQLNKLSTNLGYVFGRELVRCKEKAQAFLPESDFFEYWQQGWVLTMEQAVALVQEDWGENLSN